MITSQNSPGNLRTVGIWMSWGPVSSSASSYPSSWGDYWVRWLPWCPPGGLQAEDLPWVLSGAREGWGACLCSWPLLMLLGLPCYSHRSQILHNSSETVSLQSIRDQHLTAQTVYQTPSTVPMEGPSGTGHRWGGGQPLADQAQEMPVHGRYCCSQAKHQTWDCLGSFLMIHLQHWQKGLFKFFNLFFIIF